MSRAAHSLLSTAETTIQALPANQYSPYQEQQFSFNRYTKTAIHSLIGTAVLTLQLPVVSKNVKHLSLEFEPGLFSNEL